MILIVPFYIKVPKRLVLVLSVGRNDVVRLLSSGNLSKVSSTATLPFNPEEAAATAWRRMSCYSRIVMKPSLTFDAFVEAPLWLAALDSILLDEQAAVSSSINIPSSSNNSSNWPPF